MNIFGFVWTAENTAVLVRMWADGQSASAIAGRIGTTRNSIVGKARRLGLRQGDKPNPSTSLERRRRLQEWQRLYRQRLAAQKLLARTVEAPEPLPEPARPSPGITIMQLTDQTCRWPLWSCDADDRIYCGVASDLHTYCPQHYSTSVGRP